jgi:hypothetical protein
MSPPRYVPAARVPKHRVWFTTRMLIASAVMSPIVLAVIVMSAVLSAPLVPVFGLPLFIVGYPRPKRFWPSPAGTRHSPSQDSVCVIPTASSYPMLLPVHFNAMQTAPQARTPCGTVAAHPLAVIAQALTARSLFYKCVQCRTRPQWLLTHSLSLQKHSLLALSFTNAYNAKQDHSGCSPTRFHSTSTHYSFSLLQMSTMQNKTASHAFNEAIAQALAVAPKHSLLPLAHVNAT